MKIRNTLLFILFLLSFVVVNGQTTDRANYEGFQAEHAIYHWTTSNGLPQSHISGITQSKNQLLWIGTYNGVVSFDGRKFNRIELTSCRRNISSFITAIQAFGDTIVWATPQEIVFYTDHRIVAVYPVTDPNVFILSIGKYAGHYYFLAHDRVYYLRKKQLVSLISPDTEQALAGSTILTGVFVSKQLICLLRNPQGKTFLYTYDYSNKQRKRIPTARNFDNLKVRNNGLIALIGSQWLQLDSGFVPGQVVHQFDVSGMTGKLQSGLEGDCFFYYTKSNLVIARPNARPDILNTSRLMFGNELFVSFRDHAGNLWLGTNSLGLFLFRKYPFRLFNFFKDEPVTNSSHAFVDQEGLLWFDNDCKVSIAFDLKSGQIRHQIPNICNWVNANWSEDSLALFAYGTEHYWYNKRTKFLSPLKEITLPINNYLKVSERHFILAGEGALYQWHGKELIPWKRFKSGKTICTQLIRAGESNYYFATSEGLYHLRKGAWTLITGRPLVENPDFRSLHFVKNTPYLLIGTDQSGILRYNTQTGKLEKLATILPQLQSCWSMIEDSFGQLWVTSNYGIVQLFVSDLMDCFDGKREFIPLNHYRYENGIDNVEFNSRTQNKGELLPDGDILFSSLGGPVIIHPQCNRQLNASLGDLLLEKATINGKNQTSSFKQLKLAQGDFVQLWFTIPNFASERVLSFEYRIRGHLENWAPTANRQITLDNLPGGNYLLEIRTACGERILRIPVSVEQGYPNGWLAVFIIIVFCTFCIVVITIYYTKRAQQKKHALRDLKQQLKLLEMEALRSQMNPHFIFNCLNTIQFLFISGNVARANKYLTNFSALMRMTLDLLRQPITTLDLELKATQLYIELEQLQFDEGFDFRLVNKLHTPISQIRVPSLFFQVFVENAILHGLRKTTEKRPILTLILEETENRFIFHVCDNGPGISKQKKEDHTSMGIKLLKDRFALKSEIYNWEMDFLIRENETIEEDTKTEIIITFGKVLLESTENEYLDRR